MNKKLRSQFKSFQRNGYLVIIFGFFGFFIWASIYSLNKGVFGSGFVISKNEKIEIISPISGLVKNLKKTSGDTVSKDEEIIIFDTDRLKINIETIKKSMEIRLRSIKALELELENAQILVQKKVITKNALPPYVSKLSLAEAAYIESKGKLNELKSTLSKMKISSPIEGTLMNMSIKSEGINVTQGQRLFDISPKRFDYLIQAKIPVNLGDKVEAGMEVDISFPTLSGSQTKRLIGIVEYVSADKIDDSRNQQTFLETKIKITNEKDIQGLRAGLPATVIIKTGAQTLLSYLIRPFTDMVNRGMQ
jgi:multidrug resistance efflux pump